MLPIPYEPGSPTIEDLWQELPSELRNVNLKVTQVEQGIMKSLAAADTPIYVATIEASMDEAPDDKMTGEFYYEAMPDNHQPPSVPAGQPEVYDVRTDILILPICLEASVLLFPLQMQQQCLPIKAV